MAYSVMIWLVEPGEYPQESQEVLRSTEGRESAPGAKSGVNMAPAIPRMVYGVYESQEQATAALTEISSLLKANEPLTINAQGSSRVFLIPAQRVHYVVCDEVERPTE